MRHRAYVVAVVVVGAGLACKNTPEGGGNTCASINAQQTINATDNLTFVPSSATITAGQTVCWQNLGTVTHTVTHDTIDVTLPPNYVHVESFTTAGVNLSYHCRFHSANGMTGVIQVR